MGLPAPRLLALVIACLAVALPFGCSSGDDHGPWGAGSGGSGASGGGGPCIEGTTQECSVTLSEHNGVLSCYRGTQRCENGVWGECGNGTVTQQKGVGWQPPEGDGPRSRPLAYSTPAPCADNPCDPYCQSYDEQPDGGLQPDAGDPIFSWPGGVLIGFPGGLVDKGLVEPCSTGLDCQFNTYCSEPITDASCEHSKCQTGTALSETCDGCVESVCAADSSCCRNEFPTCTHTPCTVGSKLKASCSSCVAAVCAADDYCCDTAWDGLCVSEVSTYCGTDTCPCGANEVSSPDGNRCYFLETNNASWTNARSACQARGAGWDLASVGSSAENDFIRSGIAASTWFGFNDRTTEGTFEWANGEGVNYTNWNSGEPNDLNGEDCAEMYTRGVWNDQGCDSARDYLCEGPSRYATAWDQGCVDLAESTCDVSCGSSPGVTCAHDPCATGGPLDASCNACVAEICAADASCCSTTWDSTCASMVASTCGLYCPLLDSAAPPPEGATCEPWRPGQVDPDCPGIDLAGGVPCSGTIPVCNHGQTEAPAGIRIIHFPANSKQYPKCDPEESHPQMYECFTSEPIPPGQCISVTGCPQLVGNREIMINPPNGAASVSECSCQDNWTLYSDGQCAPPACSGVILRPGDACEHVLDNTANLDLDDVTVAYYPSNNDPATSYPRVADASGCTANGGWYYDDNANPTRIVLCPASCSAMNADNGSSIAISVGCPKQLSITSYTEVYDPVCPAGSGIQWGQLAWDTVTPNDTHVEFAVRTGIDATELAAASYVAAGSAHSTPTDTQVCALADPCIDLWNLLGGRPEALYPMLELKITEYPSSDGVTGPLVNNWKVTYSCVPNE